jgi:phenylacetate-CoA ligase
VLCTLPAFWAVGWDCLLATFDFGALVMAADGVSVKDVVQFAPTVLVGTPTDTLRLAWAASGRAAVDHLVIPAVRLVVLTGEPGGSIGGTTRRIEEALGAQCLDVYALTESGVVGWGCAVGGSIHLNDNDFAFIAIEPDTQQSVADGEPGELVVSTLTRRSVPLVRYRTGDVVQLTHAPCDCGRSSVRANGGVLGRVTERMMVRGISILPSTLEHVIRRHPAVAEYHLLVYQVHGEYEVGVQLEPDEAIASEGDRARVAAEVSEDLRRSLGLRLSCDVVPPGSLTDQDRGRRARRLSRQ